MSKRPNINLELYCDTLKKLRKIDELKDLLKGIILLHENEISFGMCHGEILINLSEWNENIHRYSPDFISQKRLI